MQSLRELTFFCKCKASFTPKRSPCLAPAPCCPQTDCPCPGIHPALWESWLSSAPSLGVFSLFYIQKLWKHIKHKYEEK